jgi:DNA processing protein
MHIDRISEVTGCPIQKINSFLTLLEMKGVLRQLPGKFFIRA